MADSPGFEDWLRAVSPESFEAGASIPPAWRRWLRSTYDERGPLSRDALDELARVLMEEVIAAAPWSRLVDDFRSTTGRELQLGVRADDQSWLEFDVVIDGDRIGSFGHGFSMADTESLLAELADHLREFALDEVAWGGWPICPIHGRHPLESVVDVDGRAVWTCPRGQDIAVIGALPPTA